MKMLLYSKRGTSPLLPRRENGQIIPRALQGVTDCSCPGGSAHRRAQVLIRSLLDAWKALNQRVNASDLVGFTWFDAVELIRHALIRTGEKQRQAVVAGGKGRWCQILRWPSGSNPDAQRRHRMHLNDKQTRLPDDSEGGLDKGPPPFIQTGLQPVITNPATERHGKSPLVSASSTRVWILIGSALPRSCPIIRENACLNGMNLGDLKSQSSQDGSPLSVSDRRIHMTNFCVADGGWSQNTALAVRKIETP